MGRVATVKLFYVDNKVETFGQKFPAEAKKLIMLLHLASAASAYIMEDEMVFLVTMMTMFLVVPERLRELAKTTAPKE